MTSHERWGILVNCVTHLFYFPTVSLSLQAMCEVKLRQQACSGNGISLFLFSFQQVGRASFMGVNEQWYMGSIVDAQPILL